MKAKLLMTASLVVCFSSIILAQDSYRPYPGELGVALRARGIGPIRDNQFDGVFDLGLFDQPTLQVRYMKSDLWTFRFDLAIDGLSAKETTRDEEELSGGGVRVEETEITSSRFDFIFARGIEYHFTGTDRLDSYFGMQVPFKLIGKLTETNSEKIDAGNRGVDKGESNGKDKGPSASALLDGLVFLAASNDILGVLRLQPAPAAVDEQLAARVEELLEQRAAARKSKDFARADTIRDELVSMGIEIKDTPEGTKWHRI